MFQNSLFRASKNISEFNQPLAQHVGGFDITFEHYLQSDIYNKTTLGDSDQSKIVLISGDTIKIPSGYTVTPASPKKSLVILCNTFINNGTISMTAKGPNVLPHDYLLLGKEDEFDEDIVIPAYANNGKSFDYGNTPQNGVNGNDGVNRHCGSGGGPSHIRANGSKEANCYISGLTGSGSAFAGGGGCGSCNGTHGTGSFNANPTYPMRGISGRNLVTTSGFRCGGPGGVGNYPGSNVNGDYWSEKYTVVQNTGVGGRIVIFCSSFTNNGTISSKGTDSRFGFTGDKRTTGNSGGASGGGAVDIFYNSLVEEGTIL